MRPVVDHALDGALDGRGVAHVAVDEEMRPPAARARQGALAASRRRSKPRSALPRGRTAPRSRGRSRCRHPSRTRPDPRAACTPPVLRSTRGPRVASRIWTSRRDDAPWEIDGCPARRHHRLRPRPLARVLRRPRRPRARVAPGVREHEIRKITGTDATSVDIAMLEIPGGGAQVELLEYKGCERTSGSHAAERLRHGSLLRVRAEHRSLPRRARGAGRSLPLGRAGGDAGRPEHGRQEPVRHRP